ncbi:MAG: hypothetical protein LKCHEGNO_01340 [Burkholderiaceae bacterium]|nr:hypothetical protein [Burkholderiaceae bacterium]
MAGTGGWLLSAPGIPEGVPPGALLDSDDCWLRTAAAASRPWLGLNDSSVASLCEKSTSAVTVARTLSRPTIGSMISSTRLT